MNHIYYKNSNIVQRNVLTLVFQHCNYCLARVLQCSANTHNCMDKDGRVCLDDRAVVAGVVFLRLRAATEKKLKGVESLRISSGKGNLSISWSCHKTNSAVNASLKNIVLLLHSITKTSAASVRKTGSPKAETLLGSFGDALKAAKFLSVGPIKWVPAKKDAEKQKAVFASLSKIPGKPGSVMKCVCKPVVYCCKMNHEISPYLLGKLMGGKIPVAAVNGQLCFGRSVDYMPGEDPDKYQKRVDAEFKKTKTTVEKVFAKKDAIEAKMKSTFYNAAVDRNKMTAQSIVHFAAGRGVSVPALLDLLKNATSMKKLASLTV